MFADLVVMSVLCALLGTACVLGMHLVRRGIDGAGPNRALPAAWVAVALGVGIALWIYFTVDSDASPGPFIFGGAVYVIAAFATAWLMDHPNRLTP